MKYIISAQVLYEIEAPELTDEDMFNGDTSKIYNKFWEEYSKGTLIPIEVYDLDDIEKGIE